MDKRMVLIGIVLLVVAFLVFLANNSVSTSLVTGLSNLSVSQNLTVLPYSYGYVVLPIQGNAQTFYILLSNFSKPINSYLFNSSAYTKWKSAVTANVPANGFDTAVSLERNGTFFIFRNSTLASVPSQLISNNKSVVYSTSENASYVNGTYYLVLDNTNGSESANSVVNAEIKYLAPITNSTLQTSKLSNISNSFQTALWLGVAFFFLLIAGIILLVFGFFRKRRDQLEAMPPPGKEKLKNDEVSKEYVDKLYSNLGRRTIHKTAKKPARKRRKH